MAFKQTYFEILNKIEKWTEKFQSEARKNERGLKLFQSKLVLLSAETAVSEEISAEATLLCADFAALKNWFFSAGQN